jgi:hypothetical protein
MSYRSSPKGGGDVDHYWLLRRNPLKAKGRQSHSLIRPRLSSSHVINAPLQEFPPTASDVLSRPTRASSAQSRTLFDSNTRPAGPTSGRTTFTISRGLLVVDVSGVLCFWHTSAILRVAKSSNSTPTSLARTTRYICAQDSCIFQSAGYTITVPLAFISSFEPLLLPFLDDQCRQNLGVVRVIGCSWSAVDSTNSFATNKHPSCRNHRLINHCSYTLGRIDKNHLEECLFPAKIGNRHLIEHYKLVSDSNWLASASCKTLKSSRLGTVTRFDPKACDIIPHSPNPTFTVLKASHLKGRSFLPCPYLSLYRHRAPHLPFQRHNIPSPDSP